MIFVSKGECSLFKKAFMNGKINEYFQYSNKWSYLYIEEVEVIPAAKFPTVLVYTSNVTGRLIKREVPISWVSSWLLSVTHVNILVLVPIGLNDNEELFKIRFDKREYKGYYEHFYVTQN